MRSVVRLTGAFTVAASAAALAAPATTGAAAIIGAGAVSRAAPVVSVSPFARPLASLGRFALPPTTAQCVSQVGVACYSPTQFQRAYNMAPLYSAGYTGRGRTIVIVDSFGSPTIAHDLDVFDEAFGLPKPQLQILQPAGAVPKFDPNNADHVGWAQETTLDVEYAHAMAPGAKIVLVETPVAETEGTVGIPEIVKAENFVINNHIGDVITQSFGATEETFPTAQTLLNLRSAFTNAAAHNVSVLASSGDSGATDFKFSGELFTRPVNSWPSSDPLVTSVGGTQLHLNAAGDRTAPDNVWNDSALFGSPAAGGGGLSHIFARPAYQNGVAGVVEGHRGTPDISMTAAVDGGALVYMSFGGQPVGWQIFGGTSEASPMFSGIVAIAAQIAGHSIGQLNPKLYALGSGSAGIPDITRGNNAVSFTQGGQTYVIPGAFAKSGYDLASGLGSVNGPALAAALAH